MQTQDIIRVLQSSDRLQIKKGKTLIYAGYVASMEHTDIEEEILSAEVKGSRRCRKYGTKNGKSVDL